MIYLVPLVLLVIGFTKYDRPYTSQNGIGLWNLVFLVLVLIIGLRYKVGADTYNYMTFFSWAPVITSWTPLDLSGFEPGFSLLTSLIKSCSDSIYVYQTILSFLQTLMLMFFIKHNTPYKFLALFLIFISMYLYFSTEVIREFLAIGGLLIAYPLLEKRKYVSYYAICLLLITIHSSAVLCLFLPLVRNLKFRQSFILYILLFAISGFFMAVIMQKLSSFFIFQKLLRYFNKGYVGYAWCALRFIYFSLLPMITLYLAKNKFKLVVKYENLICLQILMGVGLWFVPIVFQRLINYTIIFYLVSLAHIIGTCLRDPQYKRSISVYAQRCRAQIVSILLFCTILAHSSYYIHLKFYNIFIPYHSIFDPIEESAREQYVPGQE